MAEEDIDLLVQKNFIGVISLVCFFSNLEIFIISLGHYSIQSQVCGHLSNARDGFDLTKWAFNIIRYRLVSPTGFVPLLA